MNKTVLTIIILGLLIALIIIFQGGIKIKDNSGITTDTIVQNSEIRDGIQYVTINARGGYTPRVSTAKAGIPTKLIVRTNGTFDCSASLVIRSLGYQKILPQTGETTIDIGIPQTGLPLQGVCGMGMYNFLINFS